MDFSSFELQSNNNPFKQDFTPHPHDSESTAQADDAGFFHFMDNSHYQTNHHSSFIMPQLSPEEGSYTNSSVLSGQNPEFNMSPLQIATQPINSNYHTPVHQAVMEELADEEEFFTPLVSPAMAPTYNTSYQSLVNEHHVFSPLSSPALHPTTPSSSSSSDQSTLQQKLAFIERQQQQLRSMHHQLKSTKASPVLTSTPKKTLQPKVNASPRPFVTHNNNNKSMESSPLTLKPYQQDFIAPATPSLLMKLGSGMTSPSITPTISSSSNNNAVDHMPILPAAILPPEPKRKPEPKRRRISQQSPALLPTDSPVGIRPLVQQSPRALKPLISPSLKPDGKRLSMIEEETARALLTSKSNYENLKEGKAKSLGIDFSTTIQSGIENRRSAHKAAEQKRRDTLKQSFDSLRTEIMDALIQEASGEEEDLEELKVAKEKDVKQMSKVVLLQHSYEYILRLKLENKQKEEKQHKMRQELIKLRRQLGLPEVTEEEKEAEEIEKREERDRKEASLKRLQNVADNESDDT